MTTATPYEAFLQGKRMTAVATGRHVEPDEIHPSLFPFQRDLTRWSLAKGRASLFADAGLGKTRMQLEWARLTGERTLILAPLSVARQTVREAREALGMDVVYARTQADATGYQVVVTNYEMLHNFDVSMFGAVVLDESSILKAYSGETKKRLVAAFKDTPWRLCCTATPAPNDTVELVNHSEFLGVGNQRDILTRFFISKGDDQKASKFRLKGHAHNAFYTWLASWAMSLKRPSDLGYSDEGYELPPLEIHPVIVECDIEPVPDRDGQGRLFMDRLKGVTDRAAVRRQTLHARVEAAAELITALPNEPWIAWRGLIAEGHALATAIGARAIVVDGPMSPEEKAEKLEAFIDAPNAVLVTAPTIAGFGLNLQHCAHMAFVGLGDSYEQYYQSIRRSWRFGQTRPVTAYVVLSEPERIIYENVLRKEQDAETMARELVQHVAEFERAELGAAPISVEYEGAQTVTLPSWIGAGS